VWAWRKPGINSWLRAEPTQAEIPKKRSKRGPKKVKKHPSSSLLAENPKKRSKKGQKRILRTSSKMSKNPKKAKKHEKTTLYHFSRGGTLKRLRMYTP